jgi:RNA recognition motif-containing protein
LFRLFRIVSRHRLATFWAEITASFERIPKVKHVGSALSEGEDQMAKKLYVGNLSYDVKNNDLQQVFAAFGNVVSADVIIDRDSGRSKGFGFVEMSSDAEAQAAISALNGQEHNGRALTVNEAKPREERPRSGGFGGGDRGGFGGGGGGRGRY